MPVLSPLLLAALLGGPAHAKTVLVPVGGDLQDAILDAVVGDVLHLAPGVWSVCVEVGPAKDITIVGVGGPGLVTLTCADPSLPTLDVQGELNLAGVTIEHSAANRAVLVTGELDAQDIVVRGVGSSGLPGAGIYLDDGQLELYASEIVDLVTSSDGAALYVEGKSRATIVDSAFEGNTAVFGGAVYVQSIGTLTTWGTSFTANIADYGGAIAADGTVTLNESTVEGNTARTELGGGIYGNFATILGTDLTVSGNHGGGIYAVGDIVDLYRGVFVGNDAPYGAGMRLSSASGSCTACDFDGNLAAGVFLGSFPSAGGGAVYVGGAGSFLDHDSTFTANDAGSGGGGAIHAEPGTALNLYGSLLDGNDATDGGAIFSGAQFAFLQSATLANNHASGSGGAIGIGAFAYPSVYNTEMSANTADLDGGAMDVGDFSIAYNVGNTADGNTAGRAGGAFHGRFSSNVVLSQSAATLNTAVDGGAVALESGTLDVNGTRLTDNTATGRGGALSATSAYVYLYRSWLDGNAATGEGGGLYASSASYVSSDSTRFCENSASRGGAITLDSGKGFDSIRNSVFLHNAASDLGGALWITGASGTSVTASYNTVVGNDAFAYDGFAVDLAAGTPQYLYNYSNLFAFHDDSGLDTNGASAYTGAGGTLTDDTFALVADFGSNVQRTPPEMPYKPALGCEQDLTSKASVSDGGSVFGWDNFGVGAGTSFYGYDWWADIDGDGYTPATGDCAEYFGGGAINPGVAEIAVNGIDDDCAGGDDLDADDDGSLSAGWGGGDCNDFDAAIHPLAAENPTDLLDSDCDGADESAPDQDRDGVLDVDDCAPLDPLVSSDRADEPYDGLDANCDGNDTDMDADGFDSVAVGGPDCNDYAVLVNPLAVEIWYDGIDRDCDGNDSDQDYDGHDAVLVGGDDCNDINAAISPSAVEIWYDGFDGDCKGDDDFDKDGDGVNFTLDCNEDDATVYSGAPELADLLDNDCDGSTPEPDTDSDGLFDYWELEYGTGVDDADTDDDGVEDGDEWGGPQDQPPADTDGDGDLDLDDPDSDGDGLADGVELGDTDGDSLDDRVDTDDDGDGLPTTVEIADGADDLDGDGLPAWLDSDSDGDGSYDGTDPNPTDAGGGGAGSPPDGPEKYGLGCATSPAAPLGSAAAGWLALAALLLARRKRT